MIESTNNFLEALCICDDGVDELCAAQLIKMADERESLSGAFNRRRSIVDRIKAAGQGIFRRASTSNAIPSDLDYDPKIRRKFSVITHEEANERKLHTSQAHLNFGTFDWTQEL